MDPKPLAGQVADVVDIIEGRLGNCRLHFNLIHNMLR